MKKIKLIIIIFSIALFPFQEVVSMQSASYKIDKDSINFGGTDDGQSASYKLEDTMGEIGTGSSSSASYEMNAGYRQMTVDNPSFSFAIGDTDIGFGTLTSASIHYATTDNATATTEVDPGPVTLTLATNAENGLAVTIRSSNAGLNRSAPTSNTIAATGPSTVASGVESYAAYGLNAGTGLTIVTGFGTAGTTALTTSDQNFITASTEIDNKTVQLALKAGITAATKPGSYSDTLTLIATGKF